MVEPTGRPPKQVFEGVRVLDVGHIVAGPIAGSILADFGADVIKIERPGRGDPLRWIHDKDGVGLFYKMSARNKRCITLNLKTPEGADMFRRLAAVSDVILENFRPGVMERLGFGWDELRAINPRVIFCRLSGFGQTGPYSDRRAYGRIGEAFAGFAEINGDKDGPPMHSVMSLGDTVAGVWMAQGISMALYWRDAQGGGEGQVVDVGLYEPLYRQIEQQIIVQDQLGTTLRRVGNEHPSNPYVGSWPTKDGRYYSFSAATKESIEDVLRAMDLNQDERFNDFVTCLASSDAFQAAVGEWMAARTVAEIEAAFARLGSAGTPVMSAADLIEDPHLLAREMVITVDDDELGPVRMQGVVPKLSQTPGEIRHAGPRMGANNAEVYGELLGLSIEDLDALQERGVV
jgi:formyl-CoA transferase